MTTEAATRPLGSAVEDGWMQTLTGRIFYPASPRIDDIHIVDIAGALARQCRYGGHCLRFYSVAEHCVHVSDAAPGPLRLEALLHDASEAYLVDIPRPVKPFLKGYRALEDQLMLKIAEKYGFAWPVDPAVAMLDQAILSTEREQNMAPLEVDNVRWGNTEPAIDVELQFWNPLQAELEFLARFRAFRVFGGVQ